MLIALLAAGLIAPAAEARDEADEAAAVSEPAQPDRAEFVRLQQEMDRLAGRSAWAGVERTFKKILATGVPPTFDMWVSAAHAARAVGDIGSARDRLIAANRLREDKEVVDWLWDIDSNYGRAALICAQGKQQVALETEAMPFNPDHRRAVEFAVSQVDELCHFEGYLPEGKYAFGGFEVKIVPRVQSVSLDIRNMDLPNQKKKSKRSRKGDL